MLFLVDELWEGEAPDETVYRSAVSSLSACQRPA